LRRGVRRATKTQGKLAEADRVLGVLPPVAVDGSDRHSARLGRFLHDVAADGPAYQSTSGAASVRARIAIVGGISADGPGVRARGARGGRIEVHSQKAAAFGLRWPVYVQRSAAALSDVAGRAGGHGIVGDGDHTDDLARVGP